MTRAELLKVAKPILFNTDMVRAILEGRKTVTRRLVHGKITLCTETEHKVCFQPHKPRKDRGREIKTIKYFTLESFTGNEAPCQPGDIMYVRETWSEWTGGYLYKARTGPFPQPGQCSAMTWHPSIHMPKEAARIWLKVKNVRVERLQDMEPVDVINEGAYPDCMDCLDTYGESGSQCCYKTEDECSQCDSVMMEWEILWNSTIKKSDIYRYGWEANPWVWVIEFERIEPDTEV